MPLVEEFHDQPGFERRQLPIRPVCILCGRVDVKKINPKKEKP